MNDDIRIWEVDDPSKAAKPVESTNRMETEALLEGLLVRNPDMLMPGLTLVGRSPWRRCRCTAATPGSWRTGAWEFAAR